MRRGRALVEPAARHGRLEGEAHLHVGRGKLAVEKPVARGELRFQVIEMELELRADERGHHALGGSCAPPAARRTASGRATTRSKMSFISSGGIAEPSA